MTALVFLNTNPDWNKKVKITSEQINYPKTLAGTDATSEVDFEQGDIVSIYDLWVAMLVASSNQAAVALADNSGLDRQNFIQKMNDKASELGLVKTKFYDMTGLDAHNVTTAEEMAKLAYNAFSNPKIIEVHQYQDYTILATTDKLATKEIKVWDRNYSLQKFEPKASKTGFLIEAQRTVALKKDEKIIVVLHALSMNQRNGIIEKLIN
jgi:D-alanyl-D-alanine carboxypeptidase